MDWKDILIWLFIFIVGSLIVSFLIYPNSFQSFKINVKSIIPSSSNSNINANTISLPNQSPQKTTAVQENSLTKCLNEVNQRATLWKRKSSSSAFTEIVDSKQFDNSQEALNYLDMWGFTNEKFFYEQYISGKNDISIVIIKFGNAQVSVSVPEFCVDGELTQISAQAFGIVGM